MWAKWKLKFRKQLTKAKVNDEIFDVENIISSIARESTARELKRFARHGWRQIFNDQRNVVNIQRFQKVKIKKV
jgi:hypothetical protein